MRIGYSLSSISSDGCALSTFAEAGEHHRVEREGGEVLPEDVKVTEDQEKLQRRRRQSRTCRSFRAHMNSSRRLRQLWRFIMEVFKTCGCSLSPLDEGGDEADEEAERPRGIGDPSTMVRRLHQGQG